MAHHLTSFRMWRHARQIDDQSIRRCSKSHFPFIMWPRGRNRHFATEMDLFTLKLTCSCIWPRLEDTTLSSVVHMSLWLWCVSASKFLWRATEGYRFVHSYVKGTHAIVKMYFVLFFFLHVYTNTNHWVIYCIALMQMRLVGFWNTWCPFALLGHWPTPSGGWKIAILPVWGLVTHRNQQG